MKQCRGIQGRLALEETAKGSNTTVNGSTSMHFCLLMTGEHQVEHTCAYGFCILDCLLHYESDHTAGKKHSNCCEEGGAPGQGLLNLNEFNCTTHSTVLINHSCTWHKLALLLVLCCSQQLT